MAYYTTNSGLVLVPSTQYVSHGAYPTPPNEKLVPLPGKYALTFKKTSSICLGVFLVCSGAVAMAGSVIAFVYHAAYSEVGTGLWCGAMFVATGSVAIAAGCHLTDNLICATTATSAFAVFFAIALGAVSILGFYDESYDCYGWCSSLSCPCYEEDWYIYAYVAHYIMIGTGVTAFILSFSLFVVCCVGLCKAPSSRVVPIRVQ